MASSFCKNLPPYSAGYNNLDKLRNPKKKPWLPTSIPKKTFNNGKILYGFVSLI